MRNFKKWKFVGIASAFAFLVVSVSGASAGEKSLNVSDVKLGASKDELKEHFRKPFQCKPSNENDKSEEYCSISYCSGCKLWENKFLSVNQVDAKMQAKKLVKLDISLDYSGKLQPKEARNILESLVKNLGSPTRCPLQKSLATVEVNLTTDFECEWSQGGATVFLEWDSGHPYVKYEATAIK